MMIMMIIMMVETRAGEETTLQNRYTVIKQVLKLDMIVMIVIIVRIMMITLKLTYWDDGADGDNSNRKKKLGGGFDDIFANVTPLLYTLAH